MPASRKIIAEFIGVFLMGGVAGGLLTWCYTDTQLSSFMTKVADKPDTIVARINKKYTDTYHLTPQELQSIQPEINDMALHMSQIRRQFGVDILSTMDTYHQQIAAQLTPEHRDAYLKSTEARKKQLTSLLLPDQDSPNQGQK
jgi:uncharacterized membrane protein